VTAPSTQPDRRQVGLSSLTWINVDQAPDSTDLDQRHMLLFFWSPSSVPCLQSLRVLLDLLPRYQNRIVFIGVHSPRFPREREIDYIRSAVARLGLDQPVVHDPSGRLRHHHQVDALPTLVLISPEGRSARFTGEPDPRRLRLVLDQMVEASSRTSSTGPVRVVTTSSTATPGVNLAAPRQLRFPTCIKPMRGAAAHQRWAVADCGHHQIVLMDDYGRERLRFGTGDPGFADGSSDEAMFRFPQGLICSADAVFVADTGNHRIRRIDVAERRVTTVAGTGQRGLRLPREPLDALSTALASPWDLELDGSDVYFSNAGTNQIGAYNCVDRTARAIAGSGANGTADGPARVAELAQPSSLVMEDSGERLFFADSDTGLIRSLGIDERPEIVTLYGPGSGRTSFQGKLQYPLGLASAEGELLVADSYNDRILAIPLDTTGMVDDLRTPWGGQLPPLSQPSGIWAEDVERLLIVDTNNHRIVHFIAGEANCQVWPTPGG
jgi:sugar lactone lactonase YvrE